MAKIGAILFVLGWLGMAVLPYVQWGGFWGEGRQRNWAMVFWSAAVLGAVLFLVEWVMNKPAL